MAGLGLLTLIGAWAVPPSPLHARVGAEAVPVVVGLLLFAIGAGLCLAARGRGWSHGLEERAGEAPANPRALALLGAGLLVQVALIGWLGFVIASTAQYILVCAAFGSRRPGRDALIGLAVILSAYLAFGRLLGVNLGAGVLEGWL